MNLALLFELLNLGMSIAEQHTTGQVKEGLDIAQALKTIAENAKTLHDQHVNDTLDPNLVKPEAPVAPV